MKPRYYCKSLMVVPILALCGFGRAGKIHFTTLSCKSYRGKLKYIVDVSEQKESCELYLKERNNEHIKFVSTQDFESVVLADDEIKGVIVTTPTSSHEEYVCKSLEHGKGVFCEKPVAESLQSVSKCYEAADKAGLPLFCAFNRRFDDAFRSVREKVRSGAIGKILSIKTVSRDGALQGEAPSTDYFKTSKDIFHDSAVHDLDIVCWMLGEYPNELYAQGHAHHPVIKEMNDCDNALITMKFTSGAIASIDIGRYTSYGYDQRVEVCEYYNLLNFCYQK